MQQTRIHCILYMDIVGSTKENMAGARSGQKALQAVSLTRFMSLWRSALECCGALFIKDLGDGFLATFPEPFAALEAVLEAREKVEADPLCRHLSARIGMHIGPVEVKPDGDIQGPEAALAARVMAAAAPHQILVSDAYAAQVQRYLPQSYSLQNRGEYELKGFPDAVRLHEICAPECSLSLPAPGKSNLPEPSDRFIGREREKKALRRDLQDPVQRCVTLVGPAGSGKTRLALELARHGGEQ